MTYDALRQAAIECLAKAFKGEDYSQPHVVQSAVAILLTRTPTPEAKPEPRR